MSSILALVLISAGVVAVCSIYLTLHPEYHSGLFGTLGLGMMCLGAAARVGQLMERCMSSGYECEAVRITPLTVLVWCGLALFMGRHCWRFFKRTRRAGSST